MSERALFALPRPVAFAERPPADDGPLDRIARNLAASLVLPLAPWRRRRLKRLVARACAMEEVLLGASDEALRLRAGELRHPLRLSGAREVAAVAEAFAIVREASRRCLGMAHFPVQMLGAAALLEGRCAEMQTGEGKTLTATLAVVTAALAGMPVHVVTVNDYLAQRDAELMAPLYAFFGLSVGVVVQGMSPEEKRPAYACDVTYCTNKELAFDYLRDRMALGNMRGNLSLKMDRLLAAGHDTPLLLNGLHFAVVDEADSVLVDEARTPLIISREVRLEAGEELFHQALDLARALREGTDYQLRLDERRVLLLPEGTKRVQELADPLGGPWRSRLEREERAIQALTALLLFHRDEHYIVREGKVAIVDESTGRVMPDRAWSDGLHQAIEAKEGCALSGGRVTLARMTYQRFFRRYRRLSGMTGTGREIAGELWRVYRLAVTHIPTHRPPLRQMRPDIVCATEAQKWALITRLVERLHADGVPVLLGTRSVAASKVASGHLAAAGLPHQVLNAAQDREEADIIAVAGERGRITVATNMAGRGTDIKPGEGVAALGGIFVIMSERHEAGRIDRQLAGRTARQGQPGTFQAILSLEDAIFEWDRGGWLRRFAALVSGLAGGAALRWSVRAAQRKAEHVHARMRRDLLNTDESLDHALAFTGSPE
ncbi:preprotein translocase subunit SecA [Aquabacter sp. CN5-332]|uniref:preprotein translocase subunit SecA n=1 Tax=Aquabacter sp. CN5-332 TaxID=3156608 RepID=UPI0032B53266